MTAPSPYLSIVATSRNDDHGHNLLGRMQTFVNCLIGQCKRHGLRAELILVEWNPPAHRPRLAEALRWPADLGPCAVRIIEVPERLHMRFRHAAALPLFQMIAKNVGIRRARGRFVLATNIDVLFSDELTAFLAREQLDPGKMYRLDRTDVMADVPVEGSVDEQLEYCRTHLLRLNAPEGVFPLTPEAYRALGERDIAEPETRLHLEKGWYPVEFSRGELFRWVGDDAEIVVRQAERCGPVLCLELEPGPSLNYRPFELVVADMAGQTLAHAHIAGHDLVQFHLPLPASGDGRFRLQAIGGGKPVVHRMLNFRVFRCTWAADLLAPGGRVRGGLNSTAQTRGVCDNRDIARTGDGILFGDGWQKAHQESLWQRYRWCGMNGTLLVAPPGDGPHLLELDVEPGPGVDFLPLELEVWEEGRRIVASGVVRGRRTIRLNLPLVPGQQHILHLRAKNSAQPWSSPWRICDFRAHGLRWGPRPEQPFSPEDPSANFVVAPLSRAQIVQRFAAHLCRGLRWLGLQKGLPELPAVELYDVVLLHLNACGDFTLLARDRWFDVQGNPELEMYSFNIDSLLCYTAHHAGVVEEVLNAPMRLYHIEHGLGSGWTPEGADKLMERMQAKGIPVLPWEQVLSWATDMKQQNRPLSFNDANWGLADRDLPETIVTGSAHGAARPAA